MNLVRIGKFISVCRKDKNLTQSELAEKLEITDRAIYLSIKKVGL